MYPKNIFFGWLLLVDRPNTRNVLRRRKNRLEEGYNCVLCQENTEETSLHLFSTAIQLGSDGKP
jgi:hypothetical protein